MQDVTSMTWHELIEESTKLELRQLTVTNPKERLVVDLRIDALHAELQRRRHKKAQANDD